MIRELRILEPEHYVIKRLDFPESDLDFPESNTQETTCQDEHLQAASDFNN